MPDPGDAAAVNAAAVKLPPLTLKNPSLWFRRAEAKFRLAGITSQTTMADYTLNALSEDALERLEMWLDRQDTKLAYKDLKQYVMKRFSYSVSERAQRILRLADHPLGDMTVQEAWDEIDSLAKLPAEEDKPSKRVDLEREILLQRLPPHIRQALPDADSVEIQDLITQADKLLISHKASSVLNAHVHDVETDAITSKHPKEPRPQRKSQDTDLCYYHSRFGDKAFKCCAGCPRWSKNVRAGHQ